MMGQVLMPVDSSRPRAPTKERSDKRGKSTEYQEMPV
jgi:hypothetical protein